MKRNLLMLGFISASVTLGSIAESQLVPPEGGKRNGTMDDLNEMISEINTDMERYRLQQGWDTTLTQNQLEQARSQAFLEWCQLHHSDNLGSGPKFSDIKNMEVPSNLGVLDLDWLATLGNTGNLARGPLGDLTYLAGKEAWFRARTEPPDRSTFASTYPDSNWHALAAADLLLSGKVGIEEILLPDHDSRPVRDKVAQLQLQRRINESLPFLSSKKPDDAGLGGVSMNSKAGPRSFQITKENPPDSYMCVSLRAVARNASQELAAGRGLSGGVAWLGGLTSVNALIRDVAHDDLLLVGRALPGPRIHVDDVAALLRTAGREGPYCSLDPKPENVLKLNQLLASKPRDESLDSGAFLNSVREAIGGQTTRVGNLDTSSRVAHEIVMADYQLKKYDQGILAAPGMVTSCLDLCVASARQAIASGKEGSISSSGTERVWICFDPAHQPVFGTNSTGIIWLEDCPVVVRTERELSTASGELVDANTPPDPEATAFASEFSKNFSKIGAMDPTIAACENLFRLQALLNAAAYLGLLQGTDEDYLGKRYPLQMNTDMPADLPGLANGKFIQWSDSPARGAVRTFKLIPMVCGGVDMGIQVGSPNFTIARPEQIRTCIRVLCYPHDSGAISWAVSTFSTQSN